VRTTRRLHIAAYLERAGGLAQLDDLIRDGYSARTVQRATDAGSIQRIRRGWYSGPGANDQLVRAIRAGGALACVSGCAFQGLWQPWDPQLHICAPRGARHIKDPDTGAPVTSEHPSRRLLVHWNAGAFESSSGGVVPLVECLAQTIRCQPADVAFAVLESALHKGKLSAADRARLASNVPQRRRDLVTAAGPLADSGTESLFRYRLLQRGVTMRSQYSIPEIGRVDFLIGDRLIIEIDSDAHHGDREQRIRDHRRDAALARLGFRCVRFDYHLIIWDWPLVEAAVLALIERGDHLRRS
jgi:very-short-patch-repair endonuclease